MRKFLLISALCLSVSACAFKGGIHHIAVDFNDAVANMENELTLLNILRAKEDLPLHFTSISQISGSIKLTADTSLGVTVGPRSRKVTKAPDEEDMLEVTAKEITRGGTKFEPSIGGKITTGPSFDINILNTQEFYNGIMTSVSPSIIVHYLKQGWNGDLITFLFVERVDLFGVKAPKCSDPKCPDPKCSEPKCSEPKCSDPKCPVSEKRILFCSWINDPDHKKERVDFKAFVENYRLATERKESKDKELFPLSQINELRLGDIPILDGKKFDTNDEYKSGSDPIILRKKPQSDVLALLYKPIKDATPEGCPVPPEHEIKPSEKIKLEKLEAGTLVPIIIDPTEEDVEISDHTIVNGGETYRREYEVVLRSVESIIYFLGEYLRCEESTTCDKSTDAYRVEKDRVIQALIMDVKDKRSVGALVTATVNGQTYWVPPPCRKVPPSKPCNEHRSMKVIGLVQQLVNLQKSAKTAPTTQTVRIRD